MWIMTFSSVTIFIGFVFQKANNIIFNYHYLPFQNATLYNVYSGVCSGIWLENTILYFVMVGILTFLKNATCVKKWCLKML